MRIPLPPIGSRCFPLYWGLITLAVYISIGHTSSFIYSLNFLQKVPILNNPYVLIHLYVVALNGIPLILLKPYLKWKQKIAWITSESISHLLSILGIYWLLIEFDKEKPLRILSSAISHNVLTYWILAISMVIWMIVVAFQTYVIKFKYPKRWLIYTMLTWGLPYILVCLSASDSTGMGLGYGIVYVYGIFIPSLTGLGLYFSGMGIKAERANCDQ